MIITTKLVYAFKQSTLYKYTHTHINVRKDQTKTGEQIPGLINLR